jgi:hypothetical protein
MTDEKLKRRLKSQAAAAGGRHLSSLIESDNHISEAICWELI